MFKKFIVSLEGDAYKEMVFRTKKKFWKFWPVALVYNWGPANPRGSSRASRGPVEPSPKLSLSPYSFFFLPKLIANAKIFAQRVSYAEKPVSHT